MDTGKPLLTRVLTILVLGLAAVLALRLVVGAVVGFVAAVFWIFVAVALIAAVLWARSTLKSAKRERRVTRPRASEVTATPAEDPVAVEMRRITEQLREQGRR